MRKNAEVILILALITLTVVTASVSFILLSNSPEDLMDLRFGMPFGRGMMQMSGSFVRNEYEYLVHMIPHHEEAVEKANTLKENTDRQEMRQFAEGIIATQTDEIHQMKEWLEQWYPNEEHEVDYQPMMRNLEGLRGSAVDEAFIEDMIPHHMTAVMMSQQLLVRGLSDHEEVAALARSIRDNQRNEIHLMMGWLLGWNDTGSSFSNLWSTMILMGFVAMAVLAALVVWLILRVASRTKQTNSKGSIKELLDKRYAKGEISQEEYLVAREDLKI